MGGDHARTSESDSAGEGAGWPQSAAQRPGDPRGPRAAATGAGLLIGMRARTSYPPTPQDASARVLIFVKNKLDRDQ